MNVMLTCIFLFFWMDELSWRMALGEDYFWLFEQGATILLCGAYFSLQDLEEMENDG